MPLRPEPGKRYKTSDDSIVEITEQLGKMGFGGFVLGSTNHYSVWNQSGINQEYAELDLVEERKEKPDATDNWKK